MATVKPSGFMSWTVHVDADELQCSARALPYATCIGMFYFTVASPKGYMVNVWTPAGLAPRGYKRAAEALLRATAEAQLATEAASARAEIQSGSDVVRTSYHQIYRVRWCRNGYCYVTSTVNGSIVGVYSESGWVDDAALPDDVRSFALSAKPQ